MNVYDFDETIYKGDSSIDFYKFCLIHKFRIIKYIPKQFKAMVLYKFKKIDKTKMKESYFAFLKDINTEEFLKIFWNKKEKRIKKWYLEQKREDDLIISASPVFLLKPICDKLEITNLIASEVDSHTGKFLEKNCKGVEKVVQYKKIYKDKKIEEFYSDSYSDTPLAKLAEKAFIVKGNKRKQWKF